MLLYAINELSYDRCHSNSKNVFRVLNYYVNFNKTISGTPYILAPTLKEEYPQVEKAIRVSNIIDFKLKLKDEFINVSDAVATDSEVFDIFTLQLNNGESDQNLLDDPNSLVLSSELAQKIYSNKDPTGKEIVGVINNEQHVFIIKGIFKNIPKNSTFRAQCLVNNRWSIESYNKRFGKTDADKDWGLDFWTTWVLLSKDCSVASLEKQFRDLEVKYIRKVPDKHYTLQNLSDVYLGSNDVMYTQIKGNINNIRMFSVIAFLIVLVAAINYVILSTAVSTGRAREIGIRKTTGAKDGSIRNQLLSESIFLAFLVLPIALVMMWLSLPYAGKLFQTDLNIIWSNITIYVSVYLALTLFIGVASGIYTSYFLSGLKVIDILKSSIHFGKRKQFLRSSLIILQLVIFCSFVSGTIIIRSQYQFALKKDPGYYNKDILLVDLGQDFKGYSAFINNIKANPDVIMAAGTTERIPTTGYGAFIVTNFQDKSIKVPVEGLHVDYNFLNTMGIKILEGRDFSEDYGSDLTRAAILNETAVKQLGIIDPIGKTISRRTIVGVVKDFNLHSIRSDIPPILIDITDKYINQVAIHYKPGSIDNILTFAKAEWKKAAPDRPVSYSTIEDVTKEIYSSEKNLGTIISISAIFALLIASFGLFGLTLFVSKTRTKEIGIKKIFGSSEQSIIYSFLRGNFVLALSASIISIPLTLYVMTKWLNNFSYKIHISWWVFAIAFIIAAIVVLSTVFIHSYKASRINPVKALRYE
jgi:putative ABC transport system permease protein